MSTRSHGRRQRTGRPPAGASTRSPDSTMPRAGGMHIGGIHAVSALLKREDRPLSGLYVDSAREDQRIGEVVRLAREAGLTPTAVPRGELDALGIGVHQGVVAVLRDGIDLAGSENDLDELLSRSVHPPRLLVLDGITDPHNLGACLRSANAAGIDAVIVPRDRSAGLTSASIKVASGAVGVTPLIRVTNLARTLGHLAHYGITVVGTAGEATTSLHEFDWPAAVALVVGAEGAGMRRLTREHCEALIYIPMSGSVESLNVSVATGICLFEMVRVHKLKGTTVPV